VIELRTPAQIEQMRAAGRFVADVLLALKEKAAVGVNLLELDELAHQMIKERGAESCYIDYHPSFGAMPFGKVLCTSVNDAVLHGLPHDYALQDGDLLSVDFAASGWGDLGGCSTIRVATRTRVLFSGLLWSEHAERTPGLPGAVASTAWPKNRRELLFGTLPE